MRIEHPASTDLPQLRALWKEAFGDTDSYLDIFFSAAFSPDRCMCVYTDSRVAAAAYWMDCSIGEHTAAYIYAVATAQDHRGNGFCRALMDAIHTHLEQAGYCGSILVPGDQGLRTMYGNMGYADFGGIREFICGPGPASIELQRICKEKFADIRRSLLPENAVLQEGAGLTLLDALAEFYQGDACLLTLYRDGRTLRVLEYLGDEAAAAGIAAALGGITTFRAPGKNPYAMYRPLSAAPIPGYFAFAFD